VDFNGTTSEGSPEDEKVTLLTEVWTLECSCYQGVSVSSCAFRDRIAITFQRLLHAPLLDSTGYYWSLMVSTKCIGMLLLWKSLECFCYNECEEIFLQDVVPGLQHSGKARSKKNSSARATTMGGGHLDWRKALLPGLPQYGVARG
jgi:hypothetical protein